MKDETMEETLLVRKAREALTRGPRPPAAVYATIHEAASLHARQKSRSPFRAWWRRHRIVPPLATATALAALVSLLLALPGWLSERSDASEVIDRPASTLALLTLLGGDTLPSSSGRPTSDLLAEYLLQIQEAPGGFESAHALYASAVTGL